MKWIVDLDLCDGDGTCADVCPVDPTLFEIVDDKAVYVMDRADECTECYACMDSCPQGALSEG